VLSRGGFAAAGVETVPSIEAACALVAGEPELVIIGGAQLYLQALPQLHTIHLTRVHCTLDGDAHLPPLPASEWRELAREERAADERNAHAMSFITMQRV
jgi:dihydrofolate reductase